MIRRVVAWLMAGVTVVAVMKRLLAEGTKGRKTVRRLPDRAAQRLRFAEGKWRGARYRRSGGRPDPDVPDDVLADRVRSELGPLEKRLDVPRVHVMVEDHVVLLHGDVPTEADADIIEASVERMSGVRGVESYLHVGLIAGDTRPSEGRATPQPSEALNHLLEAARRAGGGDEAARPAVRAVLATFTARLPSGERDHLLSHLPADVRALAQPPRTRGAVSSRVRTVSEFVRAVATADALDPAKAKAVVESVLAQLRALVPEEVGDVAAVLPSGLRELWDSASQG